MDARKATAAVSAAGFILIAGCGGGGGGKLGGGSLPNTGNGLHNTTQPANSSKIALKFALPPRSTAGWQPVPYQPAYKQRRSKAFTPKKTRASFARKPQYISAGLLGGSLSIFIYQGSNLALTQGPFTAGTTYGQNDFYCAYSPAAATVICTNYSNVFAPLGTDTFYVAMYDSAGHLLSVTPGFPGTTNYVQATQPSYSITSSGYPSPIAIQTYGVAAYLAMDAPTSCLDPSESPGVAEAFIMDAAGYPISGPLANPVTINVTGNFALYNLYAQPVTTPYTVTQTYGAFSDFEFASPGSGSAGTVTVSGAGNVGINFTPATTRNLYAVDRLALSTSTSGINVTGLVDSGPSAYFCGALPIANYSTGVAITSFSNPVAIGEDDYVPGAGVLDNVSGTPYLTLIELDRFAFGDFLIGQGLINGLPAVRTQVGGSNPLALAVSPGEGVASGTIYILNADGSIQSVNDTNFTSVTTATLEPAGTIPGPVDISLFWNEGGSFNGDYVFATSSTTTNIFEISEANSDPFLTTDNLSGQAGLVTPTTYAVSADNIDGVGYLSFITFDTGNSGAESLFSCGAPSCSEFGSSVFSTTTTLRKGQTSFNYMGGNTFGLAASGSNVAGFELFPFESPGPTPAPFPAAAGPVTQIITTYDGLWNGVGAASTFQFFYSLSATSSGSLSGTYATIVSPLNEGP